MAYRFVSAAAVVYFGFALICEMGTSHWGLSVSGVLKDFTLALMLLAPASVVPFLGCRRPVVAIGAALTFAAAFIPGEIYARAQEYQVFRTYGPAPAEDLIIDRWAPYQHHTIAYYKTHGWTGWD